MMTSENQRLLDRMVAWARDIVDFRVDHAADGLFVAEACCNPRAAANDDDLILVALDIAFWFWIDDRSDGYLGSSRPPVAWDSLIAMARGASPPPLTAERPEGFFFSQLREQFERRARSRDEFEYWRTTAVASLGGMAYEERVSRGGVVPLPSYGEYVEAGLNSVDTINIMASAYIVNEMDRPSHDRALLVANLERYVAVSQRLTNDLFSVEKERREGSVGCLSNAILNLERVMSPEKAQEFVEADKRGYDRLIEETCRALGEEDPFVRMTRSMLARIAQWYAKMPVRYQPRTE